MTTIEINNIQSGKVTAVAEPDGSQLRARSKDNGPSTLPHLEHLVHIIRKVQRPMLLRALLEEAHGQELPAVQALTDDAKGSLPILSRNALFALVAGMEPQTQARLERAAERMALLPKGAYVVNVGRGTAIDQDALIKALDSGHLAGAALDVVVPEPLPADHPLRKAKNLLLTPHVAGNMTLGYTCERNVQLFCENLENYAAGRPMHHLVDRRKGY